MNGRWKYIIVAGASGTWAVLVPCAVQHSDAVRPGAAISAGFCNIVDGRVMVELESWSDSLGLHSRLEDARIIQLSLLMAKSAKELQAV
jgi:hypothetical protein